MVEEQWIDCLHSAGPYAPASDLAELLQSVPAELSAEGAKEYAALEQQLLGVQPPTFYYTRDNEPPWLRQLAAELDEVSDFSGKDFSTLAARASEIELEITQAHNWLMTVFVRFLEDQNQRGAMNIGPAFLVAAAMMRLSDLRTQLDMTRSLICAGQRPRRSRRL